MIEADTGEMVRLSVPIERRRQGIASTLVSDLLRVAAGRGLTEVIARTRADWSDANGFYKANGFTVLRRTDKGIHYRRPLSDGFTAASVGERA